MAEGTRQRIDCVLEDILNTMNQSKHVKIELKKTISESVCTLRNIIHALKRDIDHKSAKTRELQTEVNGTKRELQAYRDALPTAPLAPSIGK